MGRLMRACAIVPACASMLLAGSGAAAAHGGAHHGDVERVTIRFAAVNGTAPVACGAPIAGLGTGGVTADLTDLRFYISNVRLTRPHGAPVPLRLTARPRWVASRGGDSTTLIDLEDNSGGCTQGDGAMNRVITGTVPRGVYTGIRMYLGVPYPMNHTDTVTAPRPLSSAAMAWSWQTGRKFAKIEVSDPGGASGTWQAKRFNVHLGSTGCVGNPATGATAHCAASNRMAIRLSRFDPRHERIGIDIGALLAGNDITVNRGGPPGCMSGPTDPECGPVFAAMRIGWSPDGSGSGQPISGGAGQSVFRVLR